jgi:hypothetical protein
MILATGRWVFCSQLCHGQNAETNHDGREDGAIDDCHGSTRDDAEVQRGRNTCPRVADVVRGCNDVSDMKNSRRSFVEDDCIYPQIRDHHLRDESGEIMQNQELPTLVVNHLVLDGLRLFLGN